MGLITWVIAVVALIIGASALYLQVTEIKAVNFQQCTVVNSNSAEPISPTSTCNKLCQDQNKRCVFGLQSRSQQNTLPVNLRTGENLANVIDSNSQENLVSCNEPVVYGTAQGQNEVESAHVNCVCCS